MGRPPFSWGDRAGPSTPTNSTLGAHLCRKQSGKVPGSWWIHGSVPALSRIACYIGAYRAVEVYIKHLHYEFVAIFKYNTAGSFHHYFKVLRIRWLTMITVLQKNIATTTVLFLLLTAETLFPYFDSWEGRGKHVLNNGGVILFNAAITNLLLVPLIVLAANLNRGLFALVDLDWGVELALTILLIDGLTYLMHRLFHEQPFLWRFHRMHHSDTQMDVTTGARFHVGEHIISTAVRALLYAVCAIKMQNILIYEVFFLINVMFHHANIDITEPLDRMYRIFFTSPNMHKVHHSKIQVETDSNYTSLFSFWDRLFGTYLIVENPKRIEYGIKGLEAEQSVKAMLLTPFKQIDQE